MKLYFEGVKGTMKPPFEFLSVGQADKNTATSARLRTRLIRNEIHSIQLALNQFLDEINSIDE